MKLECKKYWQSPVDTCLKNSPVKSAEATFLLKEKALLKLKYDHLKVYELCSILCKWSSNLCHESLF